jgi:replicative DNA helicase
MPDDFYHSANAEMFSAISALHESGKPVDLVTLSEYLSQRGTLEAAGGVSRITDLVDAGGVKANWSHHVEQIQEKAALRRMALSAQEIMQLCYATAAKSDDIERQFQQAAFELMKRTKQSGLKHISEVSIRAMEVMETAGQSGIPSGFYDLDKFTSGFRPGELVLLGGRPSMGKTALALDLALHAMKSVPVAIFSIEMSSEEVFNRLICKQSKNLSLASIRSGRLWTQEWGKIVNCTGELSDFPIYIDDTGSITPSQIVSRVKERATRDKIEFGLIIIDYLTLMDYRGRYSSMHEKTGAITRSLKIAAKELKTPILLLSQLSRKVEERPVNKHGRRPQMSDFRESGSIEQDADIILGLYRAEVYMEDEDYKNRAELLVLKLWITRQSNPYS